MRNVTSEAKLGTWVNQEFLSCFHMQDETCTRTFSSYHCTGKCIYVSAYTTCIPPCYNRGVIPSSYQNPAPSPMVFISLSFSRNAYYYNVY